jgi:hypothetical protein
LFCSSLLTCVLSIVCTHKLHELFPWSSHLIHGCPMSIIEHIDTECSTETTLSCRPGASQCSSVLFRDRIHRARRRVHRDCHLFLFRSSWRIWVCIADVTIGLLLMSADVTIGLVLTFTCRCHYRSRVVKMTLLVSLLLNDPLNDTLWQYCHVVPSRFYQLMLERRCQSLG